jgi:hypothetical protein
MLGAGLLTIAVLEVAYYFAAGIDLWAAGELRSLDLARADSLAGWFAALVMFATAVLSLFIYSVRRYRLDDYRGRYRVWLWGALVWLAMSIDAVADLRGAVITLGVELSGRTGPGGGVLWWLAPWGLVVFWFGLRMLLDVRGCRTATASFLFGFTVLSAGCLLSRLSQLSLSLDPRHGVMLAVGCWLAASWLLFFAHVAFARHVLLDAHGQLPIRAPKQKRQKKSHDAAGDSAKAAKPAGTAAAKRDDLTTRIDPPHTGAFRPATSGVDPGRSPSQGGQIRPPAVAAKVTVGASHSASPAKPAAQATKTATQFVSGRDDDPALSHKLSRAERKRLRKQQRSMGHDDE